MPLPRITHQSHFNCITLSELGVLLSGLRVKPDPATNQPDFHAEFAEADAEIAEKKLIVRINGRFEYVICGL